MMNNSKPRVSGQDVEVGIAMEDRNGVANRHGGDKAVDELAYRFPLTTAQARERGGFLIMSRVGWKRDCPREQTSK